MSVVWVVVADQGCWKLSGTLTSRSRSSTSNAHLAMTFKRSARGDNYTNTRPDTQAIFEIRN